MYMQRVLPLAILHLLRFRLKVALSVSVSFHGCFDQDRVDVIGDFQKSLIVVFLV